MYYQNRFLISKEKFALVYLGLQFAGHTLNNMPGILSIHGRIQFVRTVWYQKILKNSVKTVETVDFRGTQLKSAETVDYSGFSVDLKQCSSIFGNISRLEFNKICMPLISIVTVYNKLAGISSISNKRIKYTFISTAYNRLITLIIIMISTQGYHILQQFCS